MTDNLIFDRQSKVTFKVDRETRTIRGLAVPYGDVGDNGFGKYRFTKGSLDWSKVKYLLDHAWGEAVGTVKFEETDEGLIMAARIAKGRKGDNALDLHAIDEETGEAVYDGLSIGLAHGAEFKESEDGVFDAVHATVIEVSGTPFPAFTNAQVRSVAASAASTRKEPMMGDENNEAPVSFSQEDGSALMAKVQSLTEKLAELEKIKIPVGPGPQLQIREEPIYRFAGSEGAPSGFDFATDLLAAGKDGDAAALNRIKEFTSERLGPTFVATTDVNEVNPSVYRPDMFLGQAPVPASPLYDFFHKGGLSSVTPFYWSKLDRATTDVGVADHAEGTDPTDDTLATAAGATVTPVPVSGQVHVNREVADQGGNPMVSGLVWSEFDRSFKIALETKTAALLTAATVTELGAAIGAGDTGTEAGTAVEAGLVGLQFLTDGFRFQRAFGHVELYKALAAATKGTDNADKLYPIINPENASGSASSKWAHLDIGGYGMYPAASLGAAAANQKSYVADPNAVHVWNSGLMRLDKLTETVAGWDMGVFAYFAGIVYDVTGLRKITYDSTE
jgi:HK97 family phage prohead protease